MTARFELVRVAWDEVHRNIKTILMWEFATLQSIALQQTLWHMGKALLEAFPSIAEVRLNAPNRHHFNYDIGQFGLDNSNEVFIADRPYGLIETTNLRDDVPDASQAWRASAGLA